MGIFTKTPEEAEAKRKQKQADAERAALQAFMASPAGKAREAKRAGAKIFQTSMALSQTTGSTIAMIAAVASTTPTSNYAGMIERIEAEGWKLENVGYVYRVTGSVSRDKFLSSGQEEAMHGEIVGIYIFRAVDDGSAPSAPYVAQGLAARVDA